VGRLQQYAPLKLNNTHIGIPCTRLDARNCVQLTKKKRQKLAMPPTYCSYCFNNACMKQKADRLAGVYRALIVSHVDVRRVKRLVQAKTLRKPHDDMNGRWNTHIVTDAYGCTL
jgi:hypothetical protein